MKLVLNDKEIMEYLLSVIDHRGSCRAIHFNEKETAELIFSSIKLKEENPLKFYNGLEKLEGKIKRAVTKDLENWMSSIKQNIASRDTHFRHGIKNNLEKIIEKIGEDVIFENYKKSKVQNYVKSIGLQLDPSADFIRRKNFSSIEEDCLVRNTIGNENILLSKIDNNLPFWFIDSGYTNFLENNKKFHRLVRNHLHWGKKFEAPVDRLGMFKSFPKLWRHSGDRILIIEPGQFSANIFHYDIKQWKYDVEKELRQYTDKKIVFREKAPKKFRENLYEHLADEDYYCLVNINSNAATEAIWQGIPVITLDKHITNSISRNKLSDINNLFRPNLASWLCMLSYSQFTFEELSNGEALKIIRKYHV